MRENAVLDKIRSGQALTRADEIKLVLFLSLPTIIAQVSNNLMGFIDSSMVGSLGDAPAASIGLMSSTIWLMGGLVNASSVGFTVQVAHLSGAGDWKGARTIIRHGLLISFLISCVIMVLGMALSGPLPGILGGDSAIRAGSSAYFFLYAISFPFMALDYAAAGMLQCAGDMRTPSILNVMMCVLDVVFNWFLIFPSKTYVPGPVALYVPRADLGIRGAALGTVFSEMVCGILMLLVLLFRKGNLRQRGEHEPLSAAALKKAAGIGIPVAFENFVTSSAQIVSTMIVAPLGTIAVASHSFSVTSEGFCYMPGYGISSAATTIVGQATGAGRKKLARRLGWLTILIGMLTMAATGALLYIFAPEIIGLLTPSAEIRRLSVRCLRIEAFAEPLFAASIVTSGVFRGAGDTLGPSILNLIGMWLIRLPLAYHLSRTMGLPGIWTAMAIELSILGILFLLRMKFHGLETPHQKKS